MAGYADPVMRTFNMRRDQAEKLQEGEQRAGGMVFNIGEFRGTFSDWEHFSREIERNGGLPVPVSAGGGY
jgi:hypothetical protein